MSDKILSGAEDSVLAANEKKSVEKDAVEERMKLMRAREAQKVDWRNKIAEEAQAAHDKNDELMFGIKPQDENVEVESKSEEVVDTPAEEGGESSTLDGTTKITRVINGKEVTRTAEEWFAIAAKVEEADLYYEEAVRQVHSKKVETPAKPKVDTKELAKKLQLGSEEDAVEAVDTLLKEAIDQSNEVKRQEDNRKAGQAIFNNFAKDYQDLLSDPVLNAAVMNMCDVTYANKVFDPDPLVNFDKKMRFCGEQVRGWKKGLADVTVKDKAKEELLNKKAKIQNLNTSGAKMNGGNDGKVLSEKEAREQAVAGMFAARKKGRI